VEILIGRGLAMCVHPAAAWRVLPPTKRMLLTAAYFGAGYVSVLSALLIL
jgi:hypothetical protein